MVDFVVFDLHVVKKYFHIIHTQIPVGVELARDTSAAVCLLERGDAIESKLAPTGNQGI